MTTKEATVPGRGRAKGQWAETSDADRYVRRRIRERRIMLGLTTQQMAELLGVTYQQAHKYETGINRISAGRLYQIAQALRVDVNYFYRGLKVRENIERPMLPHEPSEESVHSREGQQEPSAAFPEAVSSHSERLALKTEPRDFEAGASGFDKFLNVMGGRSVVSGPVSSLGDLRAELTKGLNIAALHNTVEHVYPDSPERRRLMHRIVPEASYERRAKSGRLTPSESERTARVAHVIALAEYVWRDPEGAREFLTTPHPELGDQPPIEVAVDEFGARHVEQILNGILHGLVA